MLWQNRMEAMARLFMRRQLKERGVEITLSDKEQHDTEALMRFYDEAMKKVI